MKFEEAVNFLRSFRSFEDQEKFDYDQENFDLERFKSFLRDYQIDFEKIKFVHVGGSKGKGTVATFVANYLREMGKSVGLFTSPYIMDIKECFWVNGKEISEQRFCELVQRLRDYFEKKPELGVTYFELLTALVLEFFLEEGVEFAVLEVGLGGRLDSTNVVMPELVLLNTIEKEHCSVLGDTYEEIANEKLGIVKAGVDVVIGPQNDGVEGILDQRLEGNDKVYWFKDLVKINEIEFLGNGFQADLVVEGQSFENILIRGINKSLLNNVGVALLGILKLFGKLEEVVLRKVCEEFFMEGRMEIQEVDGQLVVLDMAHTKESIQNLIESLRQAFPKKKFLFLISMMKDKNVKEILFDLEDIAAEFVFVKSHSKRSCEPEELAKLVSEDFEVRVFENAKKALNFCKEKLSADQILVVTGSHFLVGEIEELI